MDLKRLNNIIELSGIKKRKIAEHLGISETSLRNKLSGKTALKWSEVQALALVLHLDRSTCESLFFESSVADLATRQTGRAYE